MSEARQQHQAAFQPLVFLIPQHRALPLGLLCSQPSSCPLEAEAAHCRDCGSQRLESTCHVTRSC